jgi:hypothetical protein
MFIGKDSTKLDQLSIKLADRRSMDLLQSLEEIAVIDEVPEREV